MFIKIWNFDMKDETKKKQYEIKMLYTLISLLIANILYIIFLLTRDYLTSIYAEYGRFSEWSLYILADIYDLHNPYNLLVTSKKIRWGSYPLFFFKRKTTKETPLQILNKMASSRQIGVGNPVVVSPATQTQMFSTSIQVENSKIVNQK
uniref:7TM_GPCR_Srx domain-containing protein n=1 Tax=Meloidogyne hapla TaxID=6305 RepID=A0A1I8B2Y0_MELHA